MRWERAVAVALGSSRRGVVGESRIRRICFPEEVRVFIAVVMVSWACGRVGEVRVYLFFCCCGGDGAVAAGCCVGAGCFAGRGAAVPREGIGPPLTGSVRFGIPPARCAPGEAGCSGRAGSCAPPGGVDGGVNGAENKLDSPSTKANLFSCASRPRSRPCCFVLIS